MGNADQTATEQLQLVLSDDARAITTLPVDRGPAARAA
jgi:hypothetical protein